MHLFPITLMVSLVLCSLVAGLLFSFAVVVMPGIRALGDDEFLKAFKVMDRVIQNNDPFFTIVWLGSVVAMVVSLVAGMWSLDGTGRALITGAASLYLLGVQFPTATINIPLNNHLQSSNLETLSEIELADMRRQFESSWMRWNQIRTVVAVITVCLLVILVKVC